MHVLPFLLVTLMPIYVMARGKVARPKQKKCAWGQVLKTIKSAATDDVFVLEKTTCRLNKLGKLDELCEEQCKPNPCTCKNENVRLVGGTTEFEGRVEIFHEGSWGTVCHDGESTVFVKRETAAVVCRSLGLPYSGAVQIVNAGFGPGNGTTWLDTVVCNGSETSIDLCSHCCWGVVNCGHGEDLGVICQEESEIDTQIRLTGGTSESVGRVEVQHNGEWGFIGQFGFHDNAANVVCRMLSYSSGTKVDNTYGDSTGTCVLDALQCEGDERDIALCGHMGWGKCLSDIHAVAVNCIEI